MKRIALLTIALICFSGTAIGQITIPETTLTSLIGSERTTTVIEFLDSPALQSIAAASGPNQTWDFTMVPTSDTTSLTQRYIQLPATLPGSGDPAFANADFAIQTDTDTAQVNLYYGVVSGNHTFYGSTFLGDFDGDGVDDELSTVYSPPSVIDVFPIQFSNAWSDSTSIVIAGLITSSIVITEVVVDGWGTLITPAGSVSALRVNRTQTTYNPILPDLRTTITNLNYLSNDGVFATIVQDVTGSIITAEYSTDGNQVGTSVERLDESVPNSFALTQNYPNPFNPSTKISFALPEASDVTLTVFSVTGREIATLASGQHAAGTYEVSFDASNLASGLYMYRLETNNFTETRLMSLVK